MKSFRTLRESHYPTQGSSVEYPPYKEMDMKNLVKDAIDDMAEDDGPHTSDIPDMPNFTTVAKPEDVINQPSSEGNRDATGGVASRKTGKPFKTLRKKMSYGGEDFSGAVASVAIGEAVKDAADKGEYDYEGDMAKSSLRTIIRNAQMMHDMLSEDENLPEWVASKITLAEDYIVTAAQYMQSEMQEAVEIKPQGALAAAIAAYKKKPVHNPKQHVQQIPAVKKPVKKSTTEEVDQVHEGKVKRAIAGAMAAAALVSGSAKKAHAQAPQRTSNDSVATATSRDMQLAVDKARHQLRAKGIEPKHGNQQDVKSNPNGTYTATVDYRKRADKK